MKAQFGIQQALDLVDNQGVNSSADSTKQNRDQILSALTEAMSTPPTGLVLVEFFIEAETGVNLDHTEEILNELQDRIKRCLTSADVLLSAGFDRLAVVKRELTAPAETEGFALRLLNALGGPVHSGRTKGTCHSAIGVAVSHADDSATDLLRYAEHALGDARMLGGDMVVFFEDADRTLLPEL